MQDEIQRLQLLERMVGSYKHNNATKRDFDGLYELLLEELSIQSKIENNTLYCEELRKTFSYSDASREAFERMKKSAFLEYFAFNRQFKKAIGEQIERLMGS